MIAVNWWGGDYSELWLAITFIYLNIIIIVHNLYSTLYAIF